MSWWLKTVKEVSSSLFSCQCLFPERDKRHNIVTCRCLDQTNSRLWATCSTGGGRPAPVPRLLIGCSTVGHRSYVAAARTAARPPWQLIPRCNTQGSALIWGLEQRSVITGRSVLRAACRAPHPLWSVIACLILDTAELAVALLQPKGWFYCLICCYFRFSLFNKFQLAARKKRKLLIGLN